MKKTKTKTLFDYNLFSARDELWKRIRTIVSPTFTSGKMKKMFPLIYDCTKHCLNNFESHVINKKEVNLKEVFGCLTMDVIAKCAFATDINANEDKNNAFVVNATSIFKVRFSTILKLFVIPAFILDFFKISFVDGKSNQFFVDVARHMIRKRRENNGRKNDFLQLLIDCHQDKEETEKNDAESHHDLQDETIDDLTNKRDDKQLSEDEIIAQVWVFFLAGFETTASTLSYCCYELACNESIQDKLYKELISASKTDDEIDYETLSKLPYLDAVLSETLRKYPPLIKLERLVCQDKYELGGTGIILNKNDLVEVPVYALHHYSQYYPSPEEFRPERFLCENRDQIKPYTYLPFGAGPRNCVGMRFGLLEAKLALSKVIRKYKFVKSENTDVPIQFSNYGFILPAKRIFVRVKRR